MADVTLDITGLTGQPSNNAVTLETSLSSGDRYLVANDGKTLVLIRKTTGTAPVVTFRTTREVSGLAVADPTVTVAVNTTRIIGPFPVNLYGETLAFTLTNEANVSLGAIRIG